MQPFLLGAIISCKKFERWTLQTLNVLAKNEKTKTSLWVVQAEVLAVEYQ